MPEISCQTLVIAIQAVADEIRTLRAALEADDGVEAEPEDYQRLEDLERAADDLEKSYDIESQRVLNLPPYEVLIKAWG